MSNELESIAKAVLAKEGISTSETPGLESAQEHVGGELIKFSESWIAALFFKLFSNVVRFNHTSGSWLTWNEGHWMVDTVGKVCEMMKEVPPAVRKLAMDYLHSMGDCMKILRFADKIENRAGINNSLELARSILGIGVQESDFNKDPYLFNCLNGTVDLRTQECKPHNPADNLSKVARVTFDSAAQSPFWIDFLNKVFNNDQELIGFIQMAVGYSMTALTNEQVVFFCHGTGANGKSVFFEVMKMLFGDYWQKTPADMILMRKIQPAAAHEMARLPGTRFVVTSELQDNQRLNEAAVKDLTGSDTIVARHLYKSLFEFTPTHKLWMYGNHKPNIQGTDNGIWRRIRLIPFSVTIPEKERVAGSVLLDRAKDELSGILNWAIAGYKAYAEKGLTQPDVVKNATSQYRQDSDAIGMFLEECCENSPIQAVKCKDLYAAYTKWCTENSEYLLSSRKFSVQMKERGYLNKPGTGNNYEWIELRLIPRSA